MLQMTNRTIFLAGVSFLAVAASARAADLPTRQPPPAPPAPIFFSWSGAYFGVFLGGGAGTADFRNSFGSSIYGDKVTTDFLEGGAQIGYNYQFAGSPYVAGIEIDGGGVGLESSNTCFASSGFVVPANCRVRGEAAATGTVRLGYAFGPNGRTLGYIKGGVAALFERRDAAQNGDLIVTPDITASNKALVGYTVGVGVEQALTPAWSIKLEYDYADYGRERIATPQTFAQVSPPRNLFAAVDRSSTSVDQDSHTFKVGLNYHFNAGGAILPGAGAEPPPAPGPYSLSRFAPGWTGEFGGRYWYSNGRFQKDLGGIVGGGTPRNSLVSRLTYETTSSTGEAFGRIDSPYNVFIKGFAGLGGSSSGRINDEDFLIPGGGNLIVPYSNTLSSVRGRLDYATVDVGYDFLRSGASKIGAFAGYNHYEDHKNARGINQIGDPYFDINTPSNVLVLQERDTFDSVRIGLNSEIWFGQFRIQGDAAYLPYVDYHGRDNHPLRIEEGDTVSPQRGHGQGVQLELIASYYITPNFSVGAGGRYWGFTVPNGTTNPFGSPNQQYLPVTQQRYGTLLQAEYHF